MDKYNSQLPQVRIRPPQEPSLFSARKAWGYLFVLLSFVLAVTFIYMVQLEREPVEGRVCIQVITSAKNTQTGEVRDFPTPCDVPAGWEPLKVEILPNVPVSVTANDEENPGTYKNTELGYSISYDIAKWQSPDVQGSTTYFYTTEYYEGIGFRVSVSLRSEEQVVEEMVAEANTNYTKDAKLSTAQVGGIEWVKITYSVDIGGKGTIYVANMAARTYAISTEDSEYFNELVDAFTFLN